MADTKTSDETVRSPIDGTELVRLATTGANWKATLANVGAYVNSILSLPASGLTNGVTGSGLVVLQTTPTLITPVLGVATATSINKVAITAPATSATLTIANSKTLTVSNTLTFTGTDSSSVAFGAGGTVAYTSNNLSVFASTTSAQLAGVLSDETGSGLAVFATSPTLTTPVLGVATATSINKVAITAPATSSTLTIADGKTLTASNTLTFTGTDSSSVAFGAGGTVAYTANNLSVFASTTSAQLATLLSDETGSGAAVFGTTPTIATPAITGGTLAALTGLAVRSTGAAFDLTFASAEVFTAGRTLTFSLGDAARTLTIGASASVSGSNTGDQTITLTGDVTGTGTGSFATAIGATKVTNTMLNNSVVTGMTANNSPNTTNDYVLYYSAADGTLRKITVGALSAAGASGVSSFNGRTGSVSPTSGDYTVGQVTGAAASGANTDITSILLNQTGLVVKGGSSNGLTIKPNETLSAGRTLNIVTGDASRTLTFGGDITTSGAFALTLTQTATTNVTLPTTGTLATLAGSEALTNKSVNGITLAGTSSTTMTFPGVSSSIGYLGIPQVGGADKTTAYSIVIGDAGSLITCNSGTTFAVTIPANASVAFPIGTAITITNLNATAPTIAITTDTLRHNTLGTGTRTLAQYGIATILKIASTTWYITGTGLT